jgi:hypothetical protein
VPFGGTSILIVVWIIMNLMQQIYAQLRFPGDPPDPARGWPPATGWVGPPESKEVLAIAGLRQSATL